MRRITNTGIVGFFVLVGFCGALVFADPVETRAPQRLDVKNSIVGMKGSATLAAKLESAERKVQLLPEWEEQLEQGQTLVVAVEAMITQTEELIVTFKAKARKFAQNQKRATFYRTQTAKMEERVDGFFLINDELQDANDVLAEAIKKVRADPVVTDLLELKRLSSRVDESVSRAAGTIPAFLKNP